MLYLGHRAGIEPDVGNGHADTVGKGSQDEHRDWDLQMYTTKCKIDSQLAYSTGSSVWGFVVT